jgi:hypothetical protein
LRWAISGSRRTRATRCRGVAGVVSRRIDPGTGPDAIVNGDFAGSVAGNAGDQEPDVEELAVGTDAELPVAGAGEAGMAVDAAEREQGKARARTVQDSTI